MKAVLFVLVSLVSLVVAAPKIQIPEDQDACDVCKQTVKTVKSALETGILQQIIDLYLTKQCESLGMFAEVCKSACRRWIQKTLARNSICAEHYQVKTIVVFQSCGETRNKHSHYPVFFSSPYRTGIDEIGLDPHTQILEQSIMNDVYPHQQDLAHKDAPKHNVPRQADMPSDTNYEITTKHVLD
ncbi:hypothetical protein EG68_08298 [Paragonimus skrjabini miyazakii]|uniref:Saposin B-type domain-containing protein n=1 Tax=Paragonimus skrjabini miyazakii TaxID=59628 RepID=A0A8S9YVX3_9TREM|nr:hypothetical protein EG68_08298 [Paragonimus skrjabini miyazakii]